jgi:hypothetical protein
MQAENPRELSNQGVLVGHSSPNREDSAAMTTLRCAVAGMKGKLEGDRSSLHHWWRSESCSCDCPCYLNNDMSQPDVGCVTIHSWMPDHQV